MTLLDLDAQFRPYHFALLGLLTATCQHEIIKNKDLVGPLLTFLASKFYPNIQPEPSCLEAFLTELKLVQPTSLTRPIALEIHKLLVYLLTEGADRIYGYMAEIKLLVPLKHLEHSIQRSHPLNRRSPFGIFLRRSILLFYKLDWQQTLELINDTKEWLIGGGGGGGEGSGSGDGNNSTTQDVHSIPGPSSSSHRYTSQLQSHPHPNPSSASHWDPTNYSKSLQNLRMGIHMPHIPSRSDGSGSGGSGGGKKKHHHHHHKERDDKRKGGFGDMAHEWTFASFASFYLQTDGYIAAHQALEEAIRLSQKNDNPECLKLCISLLRRLPSSLSSDESSMREEIEVSPIPEVALNLPKDLKENDHGGGKEIDDIVALDESWLIGRALIEGGHPIPNLITQLIFSKQISHSISIPSSSSNSQSQNHDLNYRSLSAALWRSLGIGSIVDVQEVLGLGLGLGGNCNGNVNVNGGGGGEGREACVYARAERLSRDGLYDDALSLVLENLFFKSPPSPSPSPSHSQAQAQAQAVQDERSSLRMNLRSGQIIKLQESIWSIEKLRAERRGDTRLIRHIDSLWPAKPPKPHRWYEEGRMNKDITVLEDIETKLTRASEWLNSGHPEASLDTLYSIIGECSQYGLRSLERLALLMLCEAECELSPPRRSRIRVEWLMAELDNAELEVRAYGKQVLGRCWEREAEVVSSSSKANSVDAKNHSLKALECYKEAKEDYRFLASTHSSLLTCTQSRAHIFDRLSKLESSDPPSPTTSTTTTNTNNDRRWIQGRNSEAAEYLRLVNARKEVTKGTSEESKEAWKRVDSLRKLLTRISAKVALENNKAERG